MITTVGGCLRAEPTLEFAAVWRDRTGDRWMDTVVFDPYAPALDAAGWASSAEWRVSGETTQVGMSSASPLSPMASEPGDYFAFSYELGSGERLWIAGPHVFEVGGEVVSVSSGEALRLSCSASGAASASVVTVGGGRASMTAASSRFGRGLPSVVSGPSSSVDARRSE